MCGAIRAHIVVTRFADIIYNSNEKKHTYRPTRHVIYVSRVCYKGPWVTSYDRSFADKTQPKGPANSLLVP